MPSVLDRISAYKREEVLVLKDQATALATRMGKRKAKPRGFERALRRAARSGPALIGEIKKASPSKGLIRTDFNPADLARQYQDGGATCLSVLTDTPSFQGKPEYIVKAKAACALPVLRKDFMLDPIQIDESYALGADAILIILAMVDDETAKSLLKRAYEHGLDALVETHNPDEMERAKTLGSTLIGINNRNLNTLHTSLNVFARVAPHAPVDSLLIAESGVYTYDELLSLAQKGANGLLVGESLMRQANVEKATKFLLGK